MTQKGKAYKISTRLCKHMTRLICCFILIQFYLLISCTTTDDDNEKIEIETEVDNTNNQSSDGGNNSSGDDGTENNDTIEGQNLLINGGFEQWVGLTNYLIDGWACHNNDNVTKEYKSVYEGRFSAKMQSKKTGFTATVDQSVPVEPGCKIRILFHYYVEQWKENGARTYCYFRTRSAEVSTISANELKAFYDKNTYYIIRGGGYGLTYLPHELNVWQVFDETIEVPPTATYFVFGVNSYYGTTIYIDDCWVIKKRNR